MPECAAHVAAACCDYHGAFLKSHQQDDQDLEAPSQPQQLLQHQDSASSAAAAPAATLHEQYRPWHHPTPGSADGAGHGPKAPAAFTRSLVAAAGEQLLHVSHV